VLRLVENKLPEEPNTAAEELAADDDVLEDLTRQETIEAVRNAVLSLPMLYREAVVLWISNTPATKTQRPRLVVRWAPFDPGLAYAPCSDRSWH
jgi:hypothetical protein